MRTIPIFLISCIGLLAACTTEPDRPDDTPAPPAPLCAETCSVDADCGEGRVCEDTACIAACTPGAGCEGGVCNASGRCEPACTADADCAGNEAGSVCTPAGVCGECATDLNCKGNANGTMCGADFTCKCANNSECANAGPGLGLCRAEGCVCSTNAGCPDGANTCLNGVCVACADDADCAGNEAGSTCFAPGTVGAYCGCASNDECGEGTLCEVESGACVECLTDAECTDAANPTCVGAGTAGAKCGCGADTCEGGFVCDAASGACIQPPNTCASDADCTGIYGTKCDTVAGACTCADDSECTAPKTGSGTTWVCQ